MRLTRQNYREIATGRIDRPVENLFDADLDNVINAGENETASRIVGRLFGDAAGSDSTPPSTTAPVSDDTAGDGRTASLPPPAAVAGELKQEAAAAPDAPDQVRTPQELAVDDVRHHDSNPELNMRL